MNILSENRQPRMREELCMSMQSSRAFESVLWMFFICMIMFQFSLDMVYFGDGSGLAVMPSVCILVICITR